MDFSEMQLDSVAQALGSAMENKVWLYETNIEVWTRAVIKDEKLTRKQVIAMLGKNFTIDLDKNDHRAFYVRNNSLVNA